MKVTTAVSDGVQGVAGGIYMAGKKAKDTVSDWITKGKNKVSQLMQSGKTTIEVEAPKVHGNSKLSTKPQHGYEIYETKPGDVVKTGISAPQLNANGSSPRANSQVNKLNEIYGESAYSARVVIKDMANRAEALEWEKGNALRLWKEGNSMSLHKRPTPWK